MQETNILDVSFIRETREDGIFWRFEDHKGFRMPDRLTKELEERYQSKISKRFLQQIGRSKREIPQYKENFDFTKDPMYFAFGRQSPKIRKESEQPKKLIISGSTNEVHRIFDISTVLESEQKPFYKKLFNKFISLFE